MARYPFAVIPKRIPSARYLGARARRGFEQVKSHNPDLTYIPPPNGQIVLCSQMHRRGLRNISIAFIVIREVDYV
ncbi:hypothetical protein KCV06_g16, partial [Aureobasidium melanogenum]